MTFFFLFFLFQPSITSLNCDKWNCNFVERWFNQSFQFLDSPTHRDIKWKCMLVIQLALGPESSISVGWQKKEEKTSAAGELKVQIQTC
ncbi:hypothetical protein HHK36_027986 [Tetracentron sinense]|uniref:Secreted protein n=1 Tax=Tetracentron sinense TaxID=13715 RepID=A0A834YIN9_TETSI|nr:hypothetical protein HHK36_027986 [Tetracentron sinense]